jgi:hypothetical protein
MATYKQVNKSTNIVSVGRTAPVPRGQGTVDNSLPVVLASDAPAIPVVEQNKIASEVALSLLGIPRSEVALGIFADVNTYDVNPSEWSIDPVDKRTFSTSTMTGDLKSFTYEEGSSNNYNWGLTHVPEEAGAMIEAPPGETSTLTSKRFFRYQPGRVSSATFGVKSSSLDNTPDATCRVPAIRKYGIYDKFDGYYWETRETGKGDQFGVTRRTQSIIDFRNGHSQFSNSGSANSQTTDYGIVGKGKEAGEVFESVMNSPIATSSASSITLTGAASNTARSFKDGNIPQIGMTIQNITLNNPTTMIVGGSTAIYSDFPGVIVEQDHEPLFRESTVVTSVETIGNDIVVGLNQPPIKGAMWEVSAGSSAINTASSTDNGRSESPFKNFGRKLKFTYAGENLIIRDNLPLVHAAIYDPSMLKKPELYLIADASPGDKTITQFSGAGLRVRFPVPGSAQGVTDFKTGALARTDANAVVIENQMSAFTDSPNGCFVGNIFKPGQIVEYTTDATAFTNAAGSSLLATGVKSLFTVADVDTIQNRISLRNLATRATNDSPTEIAANATAAGNFLTSGAADTTKHFIKIHVPFPFPEVEYSGGENANVSDIMFPYARPFGVFGGTSSQFSLTGTSHRGSSEGGAVAGLLETNITNNNGDITTETFETYKAEINDINAGLSCSNMKGGRAYTSDIGTKYGSTATMGLQKRLSSGWRNWIEQNVKPEFWGVYEYKIPRSRFSFDGLNGETAESIYYSDVVKDAGKLKYPGQLKDSSTGATTRDSVWDIDFANVIMKKIEFSWYGAVGALFLAYVPSGTGEARWVRVHHLRCSNQLKTASLGNATLPLTYTVFGGGVPKQYGRASIQDVGYASGKSVSEFITKYGSSYYIDGGDRGTVRLFNYALPSVAKVDQSELRERILEVEQTAAGEAFETTSSTFRIKTDINNRDDIYIGSTVRFGANAETARVVWVERQGRLSTIGAPENTSSPSTATVYLDRAMAIGGNSPAIFNVDAPPTLFGLGAKENIQSSQDFLVRNRVQVYPTKLSAGMITPGGQLNNTSLTLTKNAIFQSDKVFNIVSSKAVEKNNSVRFVGTDAGLTLAGSGLPTRLGLLNTSPCEQANSVIGSGTSGPYYSDVAVGDTIHGWARVTDGVAPFTLFGKIVVAQISSKNNSPLWDFIPEDSYTGTARFVNRSLFTHANQYPNNVGMGVAPSGYTVGDPNYGGSGRLTSAIAADTLEIERLSSVRVNKETRRPIPGTGTKVASFFLEDGSEYFDLQPYFDYNKDYISFPLTNIPDNLFIGVNYADSPLYGLKQNTPRVAVSLTWEEQ